MTKTKTRITTRDVKLDTPTEFGAIYSNVLKEIDTVVEHYGSDVKLIFNLSAGTYGMAAVWVILQQTLYPDADVIEAALLSMSAPISSNGIGTAADIIAKAFHN